MVDEALDNSALKAEDETTPLPSENNQEPRLYKPEEVSLVVERERKRAFERAYEKGKQEALMQMQQSANPLAEAGESTKPDQYGQNITADQLRQIMAEEMPKLMDSQLQQAKMQKFVDSFANKIKAAEQQYPGLEESLGDIDFSGPASAIALLSNDLDNTGDIWKELSDNPVKLAHLSALAREQPKKLPQELHKLSLSIKQNQEALADNKVTREPFNQVRPSQKASVDNGSMSVTDFRNKFRTKR